MTCPYCGIAFNNAVFTEGPICVDYYGEHSLLGVMCSNCDKSIIFIKSAVTIRKSKNELDKTWVKDIETFYNQKIKPEISVAGAYYYLGRTKQIKPDYNYRNPIPKEVIDVELIRDYTEACLILNSSIRASAALSRRCLQNIIEKNITTKETQLNKQIDDLLSNGNLPSSINDLLHAVREIGNIAVHPIKDKVSNEIIETTPEEAELNLEVIEALFDYYYVLPAKNLERKNRFNAKLEKAGRKTV